MEEFVDDHLNWRPLSDADSGVVESLRHQIEEFDDPILTTADHRLGSASAGAIGGWDHFGNLLAFGWNIATVDQLARVQLLGGVHPAHRYKGIGSALLRWQLTAALRWRDENNPDRDLWLGCYVDGSQPALPRILDHLGFVQERYFYDLHRELRHLPATRSVDGVRIVAFADASREDIRLLHNRCFAGPVGSRLVDSEAWDRLLADDSFRPAWSWVATVDDVPVGYALSRIDEASAVEAPYGWTDRVGVAPEHRGRGIALALLTHTLSAMAADGCRAAGIGVDTTDPAPPSMLEEQLGYEPRDSLILMSKLVPPRVG